MNEIITIKQLPIIEERLKDLSKDIQTKVSAAIAMPCDENTIKEVKAVRAELNRDSEDLEEKRKAVKKAVMAPYEAFEETYKTYIGNIYKKADSQLKIKIETIEGELKAEKEKEIAEYFIEYRDSVNIDFVEWKDAGITITLSASKKTLKNQAKQFLDRITEDLALIETQEHKAEILAEYKSTLNVSRAITAVVDRHNRIEEEQRRIQKREETLREKEKNVQMVEAIQIEQEVFSAPKVINQNVEEPTSENKKYAVSFRITDTLERLRALKEFLTEGEYTYEQF